MEAESNQPRFAVCIKKSAYPGDLKVRTVYQVLPDDSVARSNFIRVIDETGEDYLYPGKYFVFVDVRILWPSRLFTCSQAHLESWRMPNPNRGENMSVGACDL